MISKMKVTDVREYVRKQHTYYTLKPLIIVLRVIGLNCIYQDGVVLKCEWSWAKFTFLVLFLNVMNAFNIFNRVVIWEKPISLSFQDIIQLLFFLGYFQHLSELYYVHKYGREQFLQYLGIYEHIDEILGMTYYGEMRENITRLTCFISGTTIITAVLDCLAWYASFGTPVIVAYVVDYIYMVLKNVSTTDVIAQITQVSYRLRVMGDLLKGFYFLSETSPGKIDVVIVTQGMKKAQMKRRLRDPRTIRTIEQYEVLIPKLSSCYVMILEQCEFINKMYGARILWIFLCSFIDMIVVLNISARIMTGSMETTYPSGSLTAFTCLIRVFSVGLVLACKVNRCEQNYTQNRRIISYVDHLLVNKKLSYDTRDHLKSLRSLVLSRSLHFHAVSFYKLNSKLILSMTSVVITYTLILLQHVN